MRKLSIFGWLLWVLVACQPEPPVPQDPSPLQEGVFISNEGNFQWGNASLDFWDKNGDSLRSSVFQQANGYGPGDVLQSLTLHQDQAYLVVNNSQKIIEVDLETLSVNRELTGLTSPRYLTIWDSTLAFATDLYSQSIHVIDLPSLSKTSEIPFPGWGERMLKRPEGIWITNVRTTHIYLLDPTQLAIVDSLEVGLGSHSMVEDANGNIWALASGDVLDGTGGRLSRFDPTTRQIAQAWDFGEDIHPGDLHRSPDGQHLYFRSGDLYRMAISASALPDQPLVPAQGKNFYSLAIDPATGKLWAADALDFVQRGNIEVYDPAGILEFTFKAGIIPGGFVFVGE
ncbi:MAG: DUF5074 domain-containing protein [Bacteroidota bacterium]